MDYVETIKRCDQLLEEYIDSERRSIIGTAYRIKAYCNYFLQNFEKSIADNTMVIEFFQNPEYHFGYEVEEHIAAAYFWRGNARKELGLMEAAKADYQQVVDLYPDNKFADLAEHRLKKLQAAIER